MTSRICLSPKRAAASAALAALALAGVVTVGSSRLSPGREDHVAPRRPARSFVTPQRGPISHSGIALAMNYGRLPLSFEPNLGQAPESVQFLAHGRGYSLYLTRDGAVLELLKSGARSQEPAGKGPWSPVLSPLPAGRDRIPDPRDKARVTEDAVLQMRLVGSDSRAQVDSGRQLPGKVNYFIGKDPKNWRTNIATYAEVKYRRVYPGVDLVYHGSQNGHLEYDFVVAPGADPGAIALNITTESKVRGPKSEVANQTEDSTGHQTTSGNLESSRSGQHLTIDSNGNLVIVTAGGQVVFRKPVVYQEQLTVDSRQLTVQDETRSSKLEPRSSEARHSPLVTRHFVDGRYVLTASNQVGFALGPYDRRKPLVIDPVLSYATYLGGSSANLGSGIAVDSSGDAYVVGWTFSTDFPTMNPEQPNHANDNGLRDAFVTELDPGGDALVYSTYLGGSGDDEGYGIALDSFNNAYVVGTTSSTDFPTTPGVFQTALGGAGITNVFVTKLSAGGSALAFSTYLGGSNYDYGRAIAVDPSGNVYVTGYTSSSNFPTANAYQSALNPVTNAFVTKFNAGATGLIYSTYLGGGADYGQGIAIDSSGSAYVTGSTTSISFPTVNAFQSSLQGQSNPFVAKLNPAGNGLVYSTFVGSTGVDYGYGIAVNSTGNAYITGATSGSTFPLAGNAFQSFYYGGLSDAFVVELNAAGNNLVYSTFLGGSGEDIGYSIALDSSGDAFVTGSTTSVDFPVTNAFQSSHGNDYGETDAFVAMLNGAGSNLTYSSYLGGNNYDYGYGIAVDSGGNAYVAGQTASSDFPTSPTAFQNSNSTETLEAFVAKIQGVALSAAISLSPNPLAFGNQTVGVTGPIQSITLNNPGTGPLVVTNIVITGDYAPNNTPTSCPYTGGTVVSGGTCTIDVTFTPTTTGARTGTVTVTDNGPGSPQTVSLTGTGIPAVPVAAVSPSNLSFGSQAVNTTSASQPVTLSNTGTANLTIASIVPSANFGQTNACPSSLAPGGSCTINVTFTPNASTTFSGTLTVTDNSNGVAGSTQSVTLGGTGVAPLAAVSPPSLAFGNQNVGTTSALQAVTLSNTGTATLTITSITASANFGQNNACGTSLTAGTSCTINVTFTPTTTGALSGSLTVTDNSNGVAGSTQTVTLGGTGIAPLAAVSPPSLAFGNQGQGTTSASQAVTLSNTGTAPLAIASITTSANFGQSSNCGPSLNAGSSCTINVTFTPATTGALSGSLTVTDNSGEVAGSTQTVTLSGTGTGVPIASLTPTTLNLGTTAMSSTSASQTATLSNTGSAPLAISSIAATSGYAQTNNCPASLTAGTSCTITITFTPTSSGPFSGTLTATDNSNGVTGSTQVLNLSGTGVDFSVAATPTLQTIAQGAQAVYTVNLGSLGGTFSNAVSLTCSNLPTSTTCAFATSSVTPGANGASTQLTLSTTAPATARVLPPFTGRPPAGLPLLLLAALLAGLPVVWRTLRRSPRWVAASGLLFFALLAMTFMAGCGAGGGFPLPKVGGTPSGSYAITVTGTSGSLQHSTTVTLAVTGS